MKLEQALKDAGVDVNRPRLLRVAESVLRGAKWNHAVASERLLREVNADAKLLRGLHGIEESVSLELASALIEQLIEDRKGPKLEAVSQYEDVSPAQLDRRTPAPSDSSRASLSRIESQKSLDRPAAPVSKGGASLTPCESQTATDRPSRSISTAAAVAFATSPLMKRILATVDVTYARLTPRLILNMQGPLAQLNTLNAAVKTLKQPPDADTPYATCNSVKAMERVIAQVEQAKQNAVAAVRSLHNAVTP